MARFEGLEWRRAGRPAFTVALSGGQATVPNPQTAESAATYVAVEQAEQSGSLGPLIATLDHPRGQFREAAVAALGRLGDERAASAVVAALADDDEFVRRAAVTALPRVLAEDKAVVRMVQALHDDEDLVRTRAAQELGELGHRHAILPLGTLLRSEPPGSRAQLAAAEALEKLGAGEISRHNPLTTPLGLWIIGMALFAAGVVLAGSTGMGFAAGALGVAGFLVALASRLQFTRRGREQNLFLVGDSMGGGDAVFIGASAGAGSSGGGEGGDGDGDGGGRWSEFLGGGDGGFGGGGDGGGGGGG
jgi:HEAT repeats